MVFFACNNCGASLKKQAVDKHYNWKCRGPKSVSCMDCQKDFHGEEYAAHTKCISEAEKYSGNDFVPKESKNTGQKKQDDWMDIIRSILDSKEYNLSTQLKASFKAIQSVDNVPRKKSKFLNFAVKCIRVPKNHVEQIWNILEKELEKIKAVKAAAAEAKKNKEKPPVIPQIIIERAPEKPVEPGEKSIGDEVETMRIKKSKSKKRKIDKEIQNTIEQDEEMEILQMVKKEVEKDQVGATIEPPSKKKSKKTPTTDDSAEGAANQVDATQENAEQEPTISTTTPDEFQWSLVILFTLKKYGNSMKFEKLKRKVQKMYLTKRRWNAFTEKQQLKFDKKFVKYVKKNNLKIENNVVTLE